MLDFLVKLKEINGIRRCLKGYFMFSEKHPFGKRTATINQKTKKK